MTSDASLHIRTTSEKDVPLILDFIRQLAEYEQLSETVTASEENIRASLFGLRACAEAVIAYVADEPVGFALFYFNYSSFSGLPGLYLEDIFVCPSARGTGIGRLIFQYLAKRAVERGCGRMEWAVLNWNEVAIRFYQSFAATPVQGWTVFRLSCDQIQELARETADS